MLAAVDWALMGALAVAGATIYGAYEARRRWFAGQLNVKLKVNRVYHSMPSPAGQGPVTVSALRFDAYNKSSSDIGVHDWTANPPEGWYIKALPIQTRWPPPMLPQTLRGKHSFIWESALVASLRPGYTAPAEINEVGVVFTVEFGEETTLTVSAQIPVEHPSPQ